MGDPVEQESMKAGITQHDFEARAGGWVTGEGCVDFVAQVFKKHRHHYVILVVDAALRDRAASAEA
jgi:hypothetical protein